VRDSHRYKSKGTSDIVLVPQPTDDPNDPLNWPYYKKVAAMMAISLMAVMPSWIIGGGAVGIPQVMKAFGSELSQVVDTLVTWPSLLLGLGVFYPRNGERQRAEDLDFFLGAVRVVLWSASHFTCWFSSYVCDVFLVSWITQYRKSRGFSDCRGVRYGLS
jgi:hypothetical protein